MAIKKDDERLEGLREQLEWIGEAFLSIEATGLRRHVIIDVIHRKSKVGKRQIERVLDAVGNLESLLFEEGDHD